jgi:hypothetical protein
MRRFMAGVNSFKRFQGCSVSVSLGGGGTIDSCIFVVPVKTVKLIGPLLMLSHGLLSPYQHLLRSYFSGDSVSFVICVI